MKFRPSAEVQRTMEKTTTTTKNNRSPVRWESGQSRWDLLNQRSREELTANEVLITQCRPRDSGAARPALAPRALFKETTLIKRCFLSAPHSVARGGKSGRMARNLPRVRHRRDPRPSCRELWGQGARKEEVPLLSFQQHRCHSKESRAPAHPQHRG